MNYFTHFSSGDNFTSPHFLQVKRTYVEEITVMPDNSSHYDPYFCQTEATPSTSNNISSLIPSFNANYALPNSKIEAKLFAENLSKFSQHVLNPSNFSPDFPTSNQYYYSNLVSNINSTVNSAKLALMSSENTDTTELISKTDVFLSKDRNTINIANDHCYSHGIELDDDQQLHFITEVTVSSSEKSNEKFKFAHSNRDNLVYNENLMPNDHEIPGINVEEYVPLCENYTNLFDDTNMLDDVESTSLGIFCDTSYEDLHDVHICPNFELPLETSIGDQNVPEISQKKESNKSERDQAEVNRKSIRVGLSKRQKLNPLHMIKS